MQTLSKNKKFVLIRDDFETADGKNFYCSKLYLSSEIGFIGNEITGECVKDENSNDIYALELAEGGFKGRYQVGGVQQGIYDIKRDRTGESKFFKLINKELLKHREDPNSIEIHPANALHELLGCLAFGIKFNSGDLYGSEDLIILNSRKTCYYLLDCVFGNPSEDETIGTIEITTKKKYRDKLMMEVFK